MNIKPREKALLIVTGCMVGVLVIYLLFSSLAGSGDYARLANLRTQVEDKEKEIEGVRHAFTSKHGDTTLSDWQDWAPDVEPHKAGSDYHDWLAKLSDQAGFDTVDVQSSPMRAVGGIGYSLSYTVRARVDLNHVVQFLHAFYSTERMHRVESVTIMPLDGTSRFDLTLRVELLSINKNSLATLDQFHSLSDSLDDGKKQETSQEETGQGWLTGVDRTLEGYRQRIVGRDLFAVYKETPEEEPEPEPESEPEPEPEPPGFDAARYAVIIAIVHDDEGPEVWIESRTEGATYRLRPGDTAQIGECSVKVLHIRTNDLVCEVDGEPRYFVRGESLRDGESFYE